jgi:hypothetical protein
MLRHHCPLRALVKRCRQCCVVKTRADVGVGVVREHDLELFCTGTGKVSG